ncbi:IS1096 element passenger TnpR family protein [Oceanobacillus caeni]|uniref:IS1096 element passenger TnpR family protein n=1 Tax=Oceanobacillus caeni TaxID=405946 RepID=UPI00195A4C3A|nr:plasmid pRiA4b ORF-3 family protein [Oceanobacillus caeni]
MIYELKITLRLLDESVFRKIQVDGRITFYDLHHILQIAFDWDNYHLHDFSVTKTNGTRVEDVSITPNSEKEDNFFIMNDEYDEKKEKISDWFKMAKDTVIYTYDFGDDWRHEITLLKKIKPEKGVKYPHCVDAEYLAPEEDSGGQFCLGEAEPEDIDRKW